MYICRTGKISDYFDLNDAFAFYEKLGVVLSEKDKQETIRLCGHDIHEFANHAPFCYVTAKTPAELITSGLMLGYPLEATSDWILRNI
jgi:hypothetical protein